MKPLTPGLRKGSPRRFARLFFGTPMMWAYEIEAPRSRVVSKGFLALALWYCFLAITIHAQNFFQEGTSAYHTGEYESAVRSFQQGSATNPAPGTFLNLGLAEWQKGDIGAAVLAWERSLWLNPYNSSARENLRFARKAAQIEAPELSWNEVVSTWLPINWWAWLAGLSLWVAVGMTTLPSVLRVPRATWHQAIAAFGVRIFRLSLPAHIGVHTRSKLGFALEKDMPLRLTPTSEAQIITRLGSGEPLRKVRVRGNFVLVRTNRATGWVKREYFGLVCPEDGKT